jgi:hypothetical protein
VTTPHTTAAIDGPDPASPKSRSPRAFLGVSESVSNRFSVRSLIRLSRNSTHEPGLRSLPSPGARHSATDRPPINRLSPVLPKAVATFRTVAAIGSAKPASPKSRDPRDLSRNSAKMSRPAVPTVTPAGGNQ